VERSLTLLLPVHNAQHSLTATVQRLLEVAAELTDRFQLVVVDDGSTDATSEVAAELATTYPQITVVRHGRRQGHSAAIRSGLRHCTGELVIVAHRPSAGGTEQVRRLYQAAMHADSPSAGEAVPAGEHPSRATNAPHAYRLLDRRKWQQAAVRSQPGRPNYLAYVATALAENQAAR
jgi:GT2 family glycosyltransferase